MLVKSKKPITYRVHTGEGKYEERTNEYLLKPVPVMAIHQVNDSTKYIFDSENNGSHNMWQEFDANLFEVVDERLPNDWTDGEFTGSDGTIVKTQAVPEIANERYFWSDLADDKGPALSIWHKELIRLCKFHNLSAPKFTKYDFSDFEIRELGFLEHTGRLGDKDQKRYDKMHSKK